MDATMKFRLGSIRKVARISAGFFVLLAGLIMAIPGVPGPGIAVMIVGLVILSDHFVWARRLLDWTKQKAASVVKRYKSHRASR
jgi:uncharacterized protein (TIGR02611 family)